jgi:aryl-alcohol dehydrogenase-like predicted oxidoreductase
LIGEKIRCEITLCHMSDEVFGTNREQAGSGMSRRVFLRATLASGASLLAGRVATVFATVASSENPTFSIGGDLPVNRLGFGAMRLTGEGIWGWPPDRENARKVLRRAVELGANLIDTADAYGPETDELLIAEALHPYPKGVVIATKGGQTRPGPDQWLQDGRPEYLKQCVENSLRRLKLERIDLYQLHRIDPKVPVEGITWRAQRNADRRQDSAYWPIGSLSGTG